MLDADTLWTLAGIALLVAIVSPLFFVLTARAYGRMTPESIRESRWAPPRASFARMLRYAFSAAWRSLVPLGVLVVVFIFAFDDGAMAGSAAVAFVFALAAAQFWLAFQLRRWERRHGFALFRETRVGFGRVAQRLVRVPL